MRSSGAQSMEASTDHVTGLVFDIQRFSVHDGPGIRTIVFFKSCPLRCLWCSNPESQRSEPELLYSISRCLRCGQCVSVCPELALRLGDDGVVIDEPRCTACGKCAAACPAQAMRIAGCTMRVEEVMAAVERDRIFYQHSGGGMTLSGGEPLSQPEFAVALLRAARERGIHSAVETAGWATPATLRTVLSEADLILYDIKHMDSAKHLASTGCPNERILQNARLASTLGVEMVARTPVIPGFNDNADDLAAIAAFALELGASEMHLLPYHKYGVPKYAQLRRKYELRDRPVPGEKDMQRLVRELELLGLPIRIGG